MKPTVTPQAGDVDTTMANMASSKWSLKINKDLVVRDEKNHASLISVH